jgi:hypothetical protein
MKRWGIVIAIVALALTSSARAWAAEARPWLCRIKPVFSSDKPMSYRAVNRSGGSWLMTFMRFDLGGGGHDGFTVAGERSIGAVTEGTLDPGQWYAIALYRQGGHWICPGEARENDEPGAGVVSDLCYGEDPGACSVKLTVHNETAGDSHP